MAHDDDARQSLLSGKAGPANFNIKNAPQRRRFCRCGSGPAAETSWPEENGFQSIQRLKSPCQENKIRFKIVFMLLVAYLGVGTICFYLVMHQIEGQKTNGIFDAMYLSVVTMTTVGYGDLVPRSTLAKLLACIYVFAGMALGGLILGKAADYLVEKQEILLVKAMNRHENAGSEILKETEIHKVKYKFLVAAVMLLMFLIVGTVFLTVAENLEFFDAFYCVCSTITTLGYGDKSFSTGVGRIFAVFWILSSTICLAQFFLYLTELYTEGRQRSLVKWVLTRKLTYSDLEAADLDQDRAVSAAEFVLYKLQEMGKITKEDILLLLERFQKLDTDHSGTLTAKDIMLSPSSQGQS